MIQKQTKKGFALIELLLTISLVSLLSGAVLSATGASRNEAKNVKVKSDIRQVERSLQSHDVSAGGYPNPNPGEKKLYCIGSTECILKGRAVATYLNPLTGDVSTSASGQTYKYNDLIKFRDADGDITQGYMYLSCGDQADICYEADDVALIYGQSGIVYSESLVTNATPASFNATTLGIINSTYVTDPAAPVFNVDCSSPSVTNYFQFGTANMCEFISGEYGNEYYCNTSCQNVINAVLPYTGCNPNVYNLNSNSCVEDGGEAGVTYYRCVHPCDYSFAD